MLSDIDTEHLSSVMVRKSIVQSPGSMLPGQKLDTCTNSGIRCRR